VTDDCLENRSDSFGRFRVELSTEGGIAWKHRNMTPFEVREVAQRIANDLRNPCGAATYERWPGGQSVCIAVLPNAADVQVSISGLTDFQACIALENVIAYINSMVFHPKTIGEIAALYSRDHGVLQ